MVSPRSDVSAPRDELRGDVGPIIFGPRPIQEICFGEAPDTEDIRQLELDYSPLRGNIATNKLPDFLSPEQGVLGGPCKPHSVVYCSRSKLTGTWKHLVSSEHLWW